VTGGARIYLVRHAAPVAGPELPPARWPLSGSGRAAAGELSGRLPAAGRLLPVASDELKALQTLELALGATAGAAPVSQDARFGEVRHPFVWGGDFAAPRRAYLAGAEHPGWERREAVAERFGAALAEHAARAAASERRLVVGSHGMAMTVWLAATGRVPGEPGEFWAGLGFPEVVEVLVDG
jgi:broad specificity phosphatase PhoE